MIKVTHPLLLSSLLAFSTANAAVVSMENFESGTASGWSNNLVTNGGATFTSFLGQFGGTGGNQTIFKDYALSGNQTEITVNFSFYEIDSWDNELFNIYFDDALIRQDEFKHNIEEAPSGTVDLFGGASSPDTNYGFANWPDQGYGYSMTFATTATNFKLGFGTTLNSGISDESWGVDNIEIYDNVSAVSEPSTLPLMLGGLAILIGLRLKASS